MGFTDDYYTDGRDPSVTPSVLFLPTEFIAVTDGISPSAKLYNVVVYSKLNSKFVFYYCIFYNSLNKLKISLNKLKTKNYENKNEE